MLLVHSAIFSTVLPIALSGRRIAFAVQNTVESVLGNLPFLFNGNTTFTEDFNSVKTMACHGKFWPMFHVWKGQKLIN